MSCSECGGSFKLEQETNECISAGILHANVVVRMSDSLIAINGILVQILYPIISLPSSLCFGQSW